MKGQSGEKLALRLERGVGFQQLARFYRPILVGWLTLEELEIRDDQNILMIVIDDDNGKRR